MLDSWRGYNFSHKHRNATYSHEKGSSGYQMPSEDLNFLTRKIVYGTLRQQYLGVWLTYHYCSYGASFICIRTLLSSVKKTIYLLLEDYYTLKTMAEVSAVFFLLSGIPGRLSSPPPGKHYNPYFLSPSLSSLVSFLSSLLTIPLLFFEGSTYDYFNVYCELHWW